MEEKRNGTFTWDDVKPKQHPEQGTGLCGLKDRHTITIKAETEGFDEAREKAEALAEAYEAIPPQVQIKNCKGCTINIYPAQHITREEYTFKK